MPKQVIVMMQDHYPFGQCQQNINQDARILVRKIYQVNLHQKNILLDKASILKKLKSQQLIKLQSVLEQDQSIHFLFQYVPIRLQTWISNINDQFIQNFRDQLIKFSNYLANNCIKIQFKLKNIGMDHDYGAKYFLDPTFIYDPTTNKQRLKSQYIRDIYNLFKPYIQNNHDEQQQIYTKPVTQSKNPDTYQQKQQTFTNKNNSNTASTNKNNATKAVSPPTYNEPVQQKQNKKKQRNLKGYPNDINVSVDEQVMADIWGVLDDEQQQEEQQQYRPKSTAQTGPQQYYGQTKHEQKVNSNLGMMKQSGGYDSSQRQNQQHSGQNIYSSNNIPYNNNNNNNNNMIRSSQVQRSKQSNAMAPPPKIGRTSQIQNNNNKYQQVQSSQQQVIWKDGDDLQNRIKKAIQNSRSIINKFKSFKDGQS